MPQGAEPRFENALCTDASLRLHAPEFDPGSASISVARRASARARSTTLCPGEPDRQAEGRA